MFKNMKLGTKIACLAVVLIIISSIMSFVGYEGLIGVEDRVHKGDDANRIVKEILQIRQQEKNYIMRGDEKSAEKVKEILGKLTNHLEETKAKLKNPHHREMIDKGLAGKKSYEREFDKFVDVHHKKVAAEKEMEKAEEIVQAECEELKNGQEKQLSEALKRGADTGELEERIEKVEMTNHLVQLMEEIRINEKTFMIRHDEKYMEKVNEEIEDGLKMINNAKSHFRSAGNIALLEKTVNGLNNYRNAFDKYVFLTGEQDLSVKKMVTTARAVLVLGEKLRAEQKELMEAKMSSANMMLITGAIAAIVIGILLAFIIVRGINKALNRIIDGLNEGAEQVASASGQVSSSSQSLAEGSSEQAASIEETSASLEEMSSMTKQNAENSKQADGLMQESNQTVSQANSSMGDLKGSMVEISKASEETQNVVKTIDEIAFQTNLLALNAAVEAARAGEAGAGFAVVAEEVRNLALRSADAAKNTAKLIEGTVKKVKHGSALVNTTSDAFSEVATSSAKVAELVSEIAAASGEQAQGIEQVNIAVTEMDKVTQSNAAGAEESAAASEELNAQAEEMKGMVNELIMMVGGSANGAGGNSGSVNMNPRAALKAPAVAPGKAVRKIVAHKAKEVNPQQVIPLDDGDFQDF